MKKLIHRSRNGHSAGKNFIEVEDIFEILIKPRSQELKKGR
jgi:hypothetical protein